MRDEWEERNFSSDTDILVRRKYKNIAASLGGKKNKLTLFGNSVACHSLKQGNFHTDLFRDMKDIYFN